VVVAVPLVPQRHTGHVSSPQHLHLFHRPRSRNRRFLGIQFHRVRRQLGPGSVCRCRIIDRPFYPSLIRHLFFSVPSNRHLFSVLPSVDPRSLHRALRLIFGVCSRLFVYLRSCVSSLLYLSTHLHGPSHQKPLPSGPGLSFFSPMIRLAHSG